MGGGAGRGEAGRGGGAGGGGAVRGWCAAGTDGGRSVQAARACTLQAAHSSQVSPPWSTLNPPCISTPSQPSVQYVHPTPLCISTPSQQDVHTWSAPPPRPALAGTRASSSSRKMMEGARRPACGSSRGGGRREGSPHSRRRCTAPRLWQQRGGADARHPTAQRRAQMHGTPPVAAAGGADARHPACGSSGVGGRREAALTATAAGQVGKLGNGEWGRVGGWVGEGGGLGGRVNKGWGGRVGGRVGKQAPRPTTAAAGGGGTGAAGWGGRAVAGWVAPPLRPAAGL